MALGESAIRNNKFQHLMTEFNSLSTFADVEQWDKEAELEIISINNQILQLERQLNKYQDILCFRSRECFNAKYILTLEERANKLQEAIDFTPKSPSEQKLILKELRAHKKELKLQKREVTANVKAIRRDARIQSVHAGRRFFSYDSKWAAIERRGIRKEKEAKLRPHEDAITTIESKLLQIDKDIFWVESFEN